MKNLISVTTKEFKRNFSEIMEMCTNMSRLTNQAIVITIPVSKKSSTYVEIAKIIPLEGGGGVKYEYNEELMNKHGISTHSDPAMKIEAIIAEALEEKGVYRLVSPEVKHKLAKAIIAATKNIVELLKAS